MIDLTFDPQLQGVKEIATEAQPVARQQRGTYTLSGVKVNGQLKPGLYIINGKKVIVK